MGSALQTLTFLYTDIEGSTRLWEAQPDAMRLAIERHDQILRRAIESQGGRVFRSAGDAFCAVFNSAPAAAAAAAEAQRLLYAEPWPVDGRLRVRTAIHSGEVEEHGGDYLGSSLNRIGRLLAACHGGQILLSAATQTLARNHLPEGTALIDLGKHQFRDLVNLENVYQLSIEGVPDSYPPLVTLEGTPNNLPVQLTSFIGRQDELAEVGEMIDRYHLVTLTGPGGTGKSRLMLQAGAAALERFPDGVWLVELAPISDPALILTAIASIFQLREIPGHSLEAVLIEHLQPKKLLLLLDNCEHLVEACAQIADRLLHASSGLKIATTSREPLGIAGEAIFRVPSLSLPPGSDLPDLEALCQFEAVRLFADRAEAVHPGFALSAQNAPSIVQICRRLDGIPLAIELAAARCKLLSPAQIASRLDDRFRLLTGGSRTALPRQQTLEALISWSYDLLSEAEKQLFRGLSVFVGGFTLEAVEALSGFEALDLLEQLVNKSLVQVEELDGETRYRLLENIRQYARDKLLESGEGEAVRNLHLAFYARFAMEENLQQANPRRKTLFQRLDLEHDNLRAALEWALDHKADTALEIAGNLGFYWSRIGYAREGARWLNEALARVEALPPIEGTAFVKRRQAQGSAHNGLALVLMAQGDYRQAAEQFEKALAIWRELDEPRGEAFALGLLGNMTIFRGLTPNSPNYAEQALEISRKARDDFGTGMALSVIGQNLVWQGRDFESARRYIQEGTALLRSSGNEWLAGLGMYALGMIDLLEGNYQSSREHLLECYLLTDGMGDRLFANMARSALADVARAENDYPQAKRIYWDTIEEWRKLGNPGGAARCLECLAFIEVDEARQAAITDQGQHFTRAAVLLGAAENIRRVNSAPMQPDEQTEHSQQLALLQELMNAEDLGAAWQQGAVMPLDELLTR